MFGILTNYLTSHSIIVIGAQLIQVQSLICREKTNKKLNYQLNICSHLQPWSNPGIKPMSNLMNLMPSNKAFRLKDRTAGCCVCVGVLPQCDDETLSRKDGWVINPWLWRLIRWQKLHSSFKILWRRMLQPWKVIKNAFLSSVAGDKTSNIIIYIQTHISQWFYTVITALISAQGKWDILKQPAKTYKCLTKQQCSVQGKTFGDTKYHRSWTQNV